ncbi:MAG: ABC transporter permease, partial [Bacteroidales bacterium]
KVNSGINILGLSLGLAIFLLIWIFVLHEFSYDKFLEGHQNIYRIHSTAILGQSEELTIPAAMFPTGENAHRELPEVENYVRMSSWYTNPEVMVGDLAHNVSSILFADSTFFTIFSFEFIAGAPQRALEHENDIVLTEATAARLFEVPEEALNQVINIEGEPYRISGVIRDLPENTHMNFNAISRQENLPPQIKSSGMNFFTYLKLKPNADLKALESKLDQLVAEHIASNPVYEGIEFDVSSSLINITDIHLHSNLPWEFRSNGSYRNVIIFALLALFVLMIAIINYVNLATARSTLRSKEIGMRKVVGATRKGLISQILFESMIITIISFFIAYALSEIFSDFFSQVLGITFQTSVLMSGTGILVILAILLITGFLAGVYPAFYIASFDPVRILKGEIVKGSRGRMLRQVLVVFQFAITIFIISSLLVISNQLRHVQNSDLGFDQEQVMIIHNVSNRIRQTNPQVNAALESIPGVQGAAGSNFFYGGTSRMDLIAEQGGVKEAGVTGDIIMVDHNFFDLMGIEILEGRNFHEGSQADAQGAFILNETASDALGFEDPLSKNLDIFTHQGPIIGIVKDFYLKSLHQTIEPIAIQYAQHGLSHIYLKVNTNDYARLQEEITKVLHSFDPAYIPDIIFLDERIQNLYQQERNSATLLSTGAILAIIISILGVYGLAAFSAERRVKEMGIRKVLGASLTNLLWVFNRESAVLVGIAFIVAVPLAWFAMDQWLENFASRTLMNPLWFVLPGIATLLLSSSIISLQAWITAKANPIKSLRSE